MYRSQHRSQHRSSLGYERPTSNIDTASQYILMLHISRLQPHTSTPYRTAGLLCWTVQSTERPRYNASTHTHTARTWLSQKAASYERASQPDHSTTTAHRHILAAYASASQHPHPHCLPRSLRSSYYIALTSLAPPLSWLPVWLAGCDMQCILA